MRLRGVEIIIDVLHVLAMIAFAIRTSEKALFQDRIFSVPQRQREPKVLLVVADPGQTVLAPAICPAAGVVVGKVIPRGSARRIILSHGAPLAFREVWSPTFPIGHALGILLHTHGLSGFVRASFHGLIDQQMVTFLRLERRLT